MKCIGIIGGLGPESTIEYYKKIISLANEKWEYKKPEIIIYSFDEGTFTELVEFNKDYDKLKGLLADTVGKLYRAGADFCLLAVNTGHIFFDNLESDSPIPLLSISDATAEKAEDIGMKKVGLLGTKMTVDGGFYQKSFEEKDIEIIVLDEESEEYLHRKIVDEMVKGIMKKDTAKKLTKIIQNFIVNKSLDGIILGCTELPLILDQNDFDVPLLDTVEIHSKAAFDYCLE